VLCRGSGDGDICFALAKHDELGRFFVFVVGWEKKICFELKNKKATRHKN
jgi:hypothetical protein